MAPFPGLHVLDRGKVQREGLQSPPSLILPVCVPSTPDRGSRQVHAGGRGGGHLSTLLHNPPACDKLTPRGIQESLVG